MKRKIIDITNDSNKDCYDADADIDTDSDTNSIITIRNAKKKPSYESIVAFECNCENYCYQCNDPTIRSITMLVSTNGVKTQYQFSTFTSNYTEKEILQKSLEVLNGLKSFKLVGYGINIFDLNMLASKCKSYNLVLTSKLSIENTIDLHKEIPKYIKLQKYSLHDVTKKLLNKDIVKPNNQCIIPYQKNDEKSALEHCELYFDLLDSLNNLKL